MESTTIKPHIHRSAFLADGARVLGDVAVGKNSSIWFNAVIRGDEGKIVIGEKTNIQDCVVLHSDLGKGPLIGDKCTVGHGAIVRAASIGDNVMIGMNATVMSGVEIGRDSIVAANALVPYNTKFPPRSLIQGVPAVRVREIKDSEIQTNTMAAELYVELTNRYATGEIAGADKCEELK